MNDVLLQALSHDLDLTDMTEETRETCRKILDRLCKEEYEPMFTATNPAAAVPPPPWQGGPTPHTNEPTKPKVMTMREFCHYLFKNKQDAMLAIVQSNREQRRKPSDSQHPFLYRRRHDEAAVAQLVKMAQSLNITISGSTKQHVDSYGEYRAEHLNYKSCVKRKMSIPVVNNQQTPAPAKPQTITTFVSNNKMDETIKLASKLTELDAERKKLDDRKKEIEAEQRELVRQLSSVSP